MTNQFGTAHYLKFQRNRNPHEAYTATVEVPEQIEAGEKKEWLLNLKVTEDIAPGDYKLEDVRSIITESNEVSTLISNSLKVKVVK